MVCENGYWFIVGVIALVKIGAEVILPPNAQTGTLLTIANEVDALLTDSEAIDCAKKVALKSSPVDVAPFQTDIGRGRIHFFTSGSTGEMKQVEKSLTLFEREASVLEQMWGTELREVPTIGTVTHQHVFGMTFRIVWPIVAGRPFHSEFHISWEPLMAQLDGPSMIVTSPAQLTQLGGLAPATIKNSPRMIITAGAPLPAEAAEKQPRSLAVPQLRYSAAPKRALSHGAAVARNLYYGSLYHRSKLMRAGRSPDATISARVRPRLVRAGGPNFARC